MSAHGGRKPSIMQSGSSGEPPHPTRQVIRCLDSVPCKRKPVLDPNVAAMILRTPNNRIDRANTPWRRCSDMRLNANHYLSSDSICSAGIILALPSIARTGRQATYMDAASANDRHCETIKCQHKSTRIDECDG